MLQAPASSAHQGRGMVCMQLCDAWGDEAPTFTGVFSTSTFPGVLVLVSKPPSLHHPTLVTSQSPSPNLSLFSNFPLTKVVASAASTGSKMWQKEKDVGQT